MLFSKIIVAGVLFIVITPLFLGELLFPLTHLVAISDIIIDMMLDFYINSLIPWEDTTIEKSSFVVSDCILDHNSPLHLHS